MKTLWRILVVSQTIRLMQASASFTADHGPFRVQSVKEIILHDAKRGKDLPVRITFPDAPGPFPIVIFSHGAYGSKDAYLPLTEFWASHGYAVFQPTHADSIALGNRLGDKTVFQTWQTRPADISFLLDSLGDIELKTPALKGRLDARRVGVGGHSFGANTAQLVGGATARVAGAEKSFEDKRVSAVMLLSGQGPGEMLTEKSWANFTRPLFVMSGSKDGPTRTGQPAEWRKKPYELSPPGDKYLVWIEGLDHGYGGITGVSFSPRNKPNADHIRWTKIATLAFWDAHLKESADAKAWLRSDGLTVLSGGKAKLERK